MSNVKVTKEQIDALIAASTIDDIRFGDKSTVVSCKLPNGFEIIESSSCVDPENYDHELGKSICLKRVADKLWMLEGYVLQMTQFNKENDLKA